MDITKLLRRQRDQVLQADENNLNHIVGVYAAINQRLAGDVDALTMAVGGMDSPTSAAVQRTPQYKRLINDMTDELDRFTIYTSTNIEAIAVVSVRLGLLHSRSLVQLADRRFQGTTANVITPLLKYLQKDSPLYKRLDLITTSTVDKVIQKIIDGVGLGWNPRKIASEIQDTFGGGLTDALRNTRTVQLWSYRDAARANYIASNGVVSGWIWYAELDGDTCAACTAEHGSIHPLDETLDGHYNCRCSAIPYIQGVTDDVQTGEDWFNGLSEQQQKQILGASKWQALQDGKFTFDQLSKQTPNDVYGSMRVEASLSDLIGVE